MKLSKRRLSAILWAILSAVSLGWAQHSNSGAEIWQGGGDGSDVAKIENIAVQCEKTFIKVEVKFDRPFSGMIYSKGHYSDQSCIHMRPSSGSLSARFEVRVGQCGLSSSGNIENNGQPNPAGSYLENTIIVQYDPQVQEVWDQARRLRCTWYDYYEKSVTFRPFQVGTLNAVTANFLGDSLQCWMQIQVGKGPWASEVSGIVKIGQTMTMVLGIKDNENKFDMLVRNCVAHNGKKNPIQLVDEIGCITRPKIMSRFQKIKNFGESATVVSYAYFQAFKFPDSMNVHFQCVIQVCRFSCPEPQCSGSSGGSSAGPPTIGGGGGGPVNPRIPSSPNSNSYTVNPRIPSSPSSNPFTVNNGPPAGSFVRTSGGSPGSFSGSPAGGSPSSYTAPTANGGSSSTYRVNGPPPPPPSNIQGSQQQQQSIRHSPQATSYSYNSRQRRHADEMPMNQTVAVPTTSRLMVLSPNDVAFRLNGGKKSNTIDMGANDDDEDYELCVTVNNAPGVALLAFLAVSLAATVISCAYCNRISSATRSRKKERLLK